MENSNEERFLELYLYNTNRKIKWESTTYTGNDAGPISLLEEFMDILKQCEKSKRHVTTAVCTRQSGLIYVSSEDDNWGNATPAPTSNSSFDAQAVTCTRGGHSHSLDLHVFNVGEGIVHRSTVIPNENTNARFHLLRRFLFLLEYSRTNAQITIQHATYTDGGASINILGGNTEWLTNVDLLLKDIL